MRIRPKSVPLLLLLIPFLQHTYGARTSEEVAASAEGRTIPDETEASSSLPSGPAKPALDASLGTKDAPVDGMDGRPHQGPFVETSAQRDRKKAKESGDEEPASTTKKDPPSEKLKEAAAKDGEKMPETNDGVMDDPNRTGPKDGTRGTEGGISEKSRDGKVEGDTGLSKLERKPDPPKEAPPLPHGEQEKLSQQEGKDLTKGAGEAGSEVDMKTKGDSREVGGLEVCPTVSFTHNRANMYTETCRSPRKTSRYPTSSAQIIAKELSRNAQRLHPLNPTANSICARLTHPTPSFFRPFLHNDHLFRNWRQNLPHRRPDGNEASPPRCLFRRFRSTNSNDYPLCRPRPRSPHINPQTIHQFRRGAPIPHLWSQDAKRRLRHPA